MSRAYYSATLEKFQEDPNDLILGELTRHHQFPLEDLQRNAWISQIQILKSSILTLPGCHLAFEYSIPRMGKRVDVILLYQGIVFALEFKVGEKTYPNSALEQSLDYAIDLKNFHEKSHDRAIVPIVVSTEADDYSLTIESYPDRVFLPIKSNKENFSSHIKIIATSINEKIALDPTAWIESIYKPTPTIIEAAQACSGLIIPDTFLGRTLRPAIEVFHGNEKKFFI